MKFQMDCDVKSKVILSDTFTITETGRQIVLTRDEKGLWNHIRITVNVTRPEKFRWGLVPVTNPGPNEAPVSVEAHFDIELFDEMISDLQSIESSLAITFPIESINWGSPTLNVIFEHDSERVPGWEPLLDLKWGRGELKPVSGRDQELAAVILASRLYKSLATIQSFYREGQNEINEGKFINAFYDFYFVLEGLYGDGKTKNVKVLERFKKSKELRSSVERYLNGKHVMKHITQVKGMLDRINKKPEPDSFLHLIVYTRGDLHHFINNPNRLQPSPFRHEEFEGIAFLVAYLARLGIAHAMTRLNPVKSGT